MSVNEEYTDKLINYALELGAVDAVRFEVDDIVFDSRTLLKCMFGCEDWGNGLTCPSANPHVTMQQYESMIRKYKYGIIVHANDKKTNHNISFELEHKAYKDGYYMAFSMSDCAQCKKCAGFENKPCRNKKKARPAFHSLGIDVYATVRKLGLPIYTLKDNDERVENWYAAVLIE
jgi:predicted metal-binding protein